VIFFAKLLNKYINLKISKLKMAKGTTGGAFTATPKKKRKGVHAKTKTTKNKGAANYKKSYKGQGK